VVHPVSDPLPVIMVCDGLVVLVNDDVEGSTDDDKEWDAARREMASAFRFKDFSGFSVDMTLYVLGLECLFRVMKGNSACPCCSRLAKRGRAEP
jgi:hypothetical protein